MARFDNAVAAAHGTMRQLTLEEREQSARLQLHWSLPVKLGGMGTPQMSSFASLAAWWAAQYAARSRMSTEIKKLGGDPSTLVTENSRERLAVQERLLALGVKPCAFFPALGEDFFSFYEKNEAAIVKAGIKMQHWLTAQLHQHRYKELSDSAAPKERERMEVQRKYLTPHLPLLCVPAKPGAKVFNVPFRQFMRERDGLAPVPSLPLRCTCGKLHDGGDALHHYKCSSNAGGWQFAHNALVEAIAGVMADAGMQCDVKARYMGDAQEKHGVVPDIVAFDCDAKRLVVDVSLTSADAQILSPRSRDRATAAAERREQFKQGKFAGLSKGWQGSKFRPFVVERPQLRICPESEQLLDMILRDGARRDIRKLRTKTEVLSRVVACVCRGNSAIVQRCLNKDQRADLQTAVSARGARPSARLFSGFVARARSAG